jgi:hypothetical protein
VITALLPLPAGLLMPVTTALDHPNVAVVLELVAVYVFEVLLHQFAVAKLVTTAIGLTVTETSRGVPEHVLTVGVII